LWLCGRVNSKNGFGAYSGFERFVAPEHGLILESAEPQFPEIWSRACAHKIRTVSF